MSSVGVKGNVDQGFKTLVVSWPANTSAKLVSSPHTLTTVPIGTVPRWTPHDLRGWRRWELSS